MVLALCRDSSQPQTRPYAQSCRLDASRNGKKSEHRAAKIIPFTTRSRNAPHHPEIRNRENVRTGKKELAIALDSEKARKNENNPKTKILV